MKIHSFLILGLIFVSVIAETPSSTSSYLSDADRVRLRKVIESGFQLDDVSAVHYAVLGHNLIGDTIPRTAEICKFLLQSTGDGSSLTPENAYYITSTWKTLKVCQALPVAAITKALTAVIEKEGSTILEFHYAINSLTALSQKLSDAVTSKVVKNLQAILKKDDSLLNLGYAFKIAADLGAAGAFAFERIEDTIVQADEVNGRFLQFEGGLTVTSLIVNGIFQLSSNLKKKLPLSSHQTVKFTNYLLSRRSVQTPKGVVSLLSALDVLATNEYEKPICIALMEGENIVSTKQPLIRVKICNILGKPLASTPTVVANTATRVGDDVVVLNKKNFQVDPKDKTLFTTNLMDAKPERGFYKVAISAGSISNTVTVKVLSEAVVDYLEIGTADADQTMQPKLVRVSYSEKMKDKIEADSQQKLVMRFLLKDSLTKKAMRVHQAFVRLSSVPQPGKEKLTNEIIFVAEPDASHIYKFDMPLATAAKNFGHQSGDYNVELVIGDAVLSNSFQWNLGTVNLKFPEPTAAELAEKSSVYKDKQNMYQPKPEIKHMFREPEKRPPAFVSNLFTGLCLAPVLLLFILWAKLGINISNFPLSLSAIGFHVGLGGIFVLFGVFWLKLNMFVTLRYLLGLGIVTFLAGSKLLSQIAQGQKHNR
ncbi:dolichyl-diphosphooligosaccharide--protein glycosyltransferase subunit 2 [Leptopilina heterotoma]|uniref:dolichyl-diphosphooligosaccharide--protein glycosyltransferase subunit 2 n=1 Tax=Leptopilina heterotoma TaxID=63436 RepID=UPI001CA8270E|nr:dolichyl-diphosphooligosaccharide--protein glycosyltransferase subunit 2 [Leptopilina heterotoma]